MSGIAYLKKINSPLFVNLSETRYLSNLQLSTNIFYVFPFSEKSISLYFSLIFWLFSHILLFYLSGIAYLNKMNSPLFVNFVRDTISVQPTTWINQYILWISFFRKIYFPAFFSNSLAIFLYFIIFHWSIYLELLV